MLSLIGFFAIVFVIIKYFPDILKFTMYAAVIVIALYFLIGGLLWIFGSSLAIHMNATMMGI